MATLTHVSQNSGSLPDGQSFVLMPESRVLEDSLSSGYSQPLRVSEPPQKPGTCLGTDAAFEQSGLSGCPDGLSWGGQCLYAAKQIRAGKPVFVLAQLCHC